MTLLKAFHFPVLFQTTTFEIQRLKCNVVLVPDVIEHQNVTRMASPGRVGCGKARSEVPNNEFI
jgi:hypothetical protein